MEGSDFSELRAEDETRVVPIRHPSTGKVLASITLYHIDASGPRELRRRQERRRLKSVSAGVKIDPESFEQDLLDLLTACTKSWEGVSWKGQDLPCTRNAVRKFYEDVPWVRRQVNDVVNDIGFFLETSDPHGETSSDTTSA